MTKQVLVFDAISAGHRGNYVSTFARLLDGEALIGPPHLNWRRLLSAPRLLLPTLETSPRFYALLVLLRTMLMKRTVIFILRPQLPPRGAMRWMKLITHRMLVALPGVHVATIFDVEKTSHLAGRATLIRDLEYWDRAGCPPPKPTALSDRALRAASNGRRIVVSLGWFSDDKGGNMLLDIFADTSVTEHFFLVIAGPPGPEMIDRLTTLPDSQILVESRLIDDDELMSLYAIADLSWCCYAPERDISSGVFGRSLQFGVPAIVRENSLLHRQAENFGEAIAVPWNQSDTAAEHMLGWLDSKPADIDPVSTGLALEFNAETELRKLRTLLSL